MTKAIDYSVYYYGMEGVTYWKWLTFGVGLGFYKIKYSPDNIPSYGTEQNLNKRAYPFYKWILGTYF